MARRPEDGRRIDGILVVAKPAGPTSHDLIDTVRRLTGVRRVGHGGTLDPFAMGVLPIFVGRATRMVDYHRGDDKAYRATVVFGASSTTDDLDGELTPGAGRVPDESAVSAALDAFRGPISQVPPDHSAVHVAGRRAYELARDGQELRLPPREVVVHELRLTGWDDSDADRPVAELEIRCSAGTYIRALARDLGRELGCGAYLGALVRTASGPFGLEAAVSLEHLRSALARGELESLLLAPDAGLGHLPRVQVDEPSREAIARGQAVRLGAGVVASAGPVLPVSAEAVRIVDEHGALVAMARLEGGLLQPDKVFISPVATGHR
jgi:tRNA pseudouridine55 synthase